MICFSSGAVFLLIKIFVNLEIHIDEKNHAFAT